MLLVYAGLLGLAFMLLAPTDTGLLAKRTGRSFTVWFFIAMLLPLIATLILCFLPGQDQKKVS